MKIKTFFILCWDHNVFHESIMEKYPGRKIEYSSNSDFKITYNGERYRFIRVHEGMLNKLRGHRGISLILILNKKPNDNLMMEDVVARRNGEVLTRLSYQAGMNIDDLLKSAEIWFEPGCPYGEELKKTKIFGELG